MTDVDMSRWPKWCREMVRFPYLRERIEIVGVEEVLARICKLAEEMFVRGDHSDRQHELAARFVFEEMYLRNGVFPDVIKKFQRGETEDGKTVEP